MDALAGYGSDDSDDDVPQNTSTLSGLTAYGDEDGEDNKEQEPLQKRLKQEPETKDTVLPPPPLGNDSIIKSEVDHFTSKYGTLLDSTVEMPAKLQQLSSSTNWADQLKSQHEFHNPAFFQTVVEHFGIQDVLGSNMECQETLHDYEFDLVRLEEEARIRQQVDHQAIATPTPYAQEQLERAMQMHLRR